MADASLPFRLHGLLKSYLDLPSLLPALKDYRLVRDDEALTLSKRWEGGHRMAAVDELLALLPRTGPSWKEELYRVIVTSVRDESADTHRGHYYIVEEWGKLYGTGTEYTHASGSLEREVQCLRREVKGLTLRVKELEDQLFIERSKGAVPIAGEFRKRPAPTLVEMLHGHIDDVQSMLEELRGLVENCSATPLRSTKTVGQVLERIKMLSALGTHIKLKCHDHSFMIEQDLQISLAQLEIATKAFKLTLHRSTPCAGLQSDQALYVILSLSLTVAELAKHTTTAADLLWEM